MQNQYPGTETRTLVSEALVQSGDIELGKLLVAFLPLFGRRRGIDEVDMKEINSIEEIFVTTGQLRIQSDELPAKGTAGLFSPPQSFAGLSWT